VVVCLELGADLHMAQLMPLPPTVSCCSKIQIGFLPFWYWLTWVVPDKGLLNVCVCDNSLLSVNMFKYLGHIIENSFSDDSDITEKSKCCLQVPVYCVDASNDAHWL